MRSGIGIIRVHLDREAVGGIEDLDEEREASLVAFAVREELSVLIPELGEVHAVKGAAGDRAVPCRMGADGPAFADLPIRNLVAELGLELPAAPDLRHEDRLHEDDAHRRPSISCHVTLPCSAIGCHCILPA